MYLSDLNKSLLIDVVLMSEDVISSSHPLSPPILEDLPASWFGPLPSRRVGIAAFGSADFLTSRC